MAESGLHISAPLVVAAWGGLNALLTALQAGMGGTAVPLTIYGSAVILVELVAAAVALSRRWRPAGSAKRAPPGGATALWLAIGAGIAGLGLAYGWWVTILSVPAFIAAAVNEAYIWHKRSLGVTAGQVVVGAPAERAQPQQPEENAGRRAVR